jgi:hypothetical protein
MLICRELRHADFSLLALNLSGLGILLQQSLKTDRIAVLICSGLAEPGRTYC